MQLIEGLLNWLFPPKCLLCQKILDDGDGDICPHCQKEAPWIPDDKRKQTVQGFSHAAVFFYEDGVRKAVHGLKFQGESYMAKAMGQHMAQVAAEEFPGEFDTITWAPVSKKRRRERGYDQGFLLAKHMAKVWGEQPVALLKKTTHTKAQSSLQGAAARRGNVLGVYELVDASTVNGKHILLVDDVCTTGSTLAECVRILKLGGAASVVCISFARTKG